MRIPNVPVDLKEAKALLIQKFIDKVIVLLTYEGPEPIKKLSDLAQGYVDEFTELLKQDTSEFFSQREPRTGLNIRQRMFYM